MAFFSVGLKSSIANNRETSAVPTLISSNADAVTLHEISISFSNASRALLSSNIDSGSGSYSSSWSVLVGAYWP